MHKLLIEDDEGKTVAVPLIREEITIGRIDGNTIRLTEQNVSRKHARLTLRSGVLRIEDLGSYNGTRLNGSTLSGVATLKDGDVILIGDYRLGIQEEASAAKPAETAAPAPAPAPVVEEALEGQPTIPISTMMAQGLSQTAFAEPPARLVVASRFMAGTEFVLDRPSQVLGRTPENDIVLNHKSISRHHAKVVRDGSRYVILDLESANGVRVGGSEVDRTELQSGDIIELGEVRLRFFSGDSALDEPVSAWYRNKKILAGAGGGAVGVVILLVVMLSGGHKASAPVVASAPVEPPAVVTPPPVPPVVQPTPPTPPPAEEPKAAEPAAPEPKAEPAVPIADLLADAKKKAKAEKWEDALALIAKAVAQEPGSTDAATLRKAVEAEKQYSEKMAALKQAMAAKDYDTVLQGTSEIPDESMYKPRATDLHKNAQTQFVALHLQAATTKLAANDCDEARREAELVLGVEAKNKRAAGVVKKCEALAAKAAEPAPKEEPKPEPAPKPEPVAAVAAKPAPRPKAAPVVAHAPKPKAPEPAKAAEPASTADADKLIKDAQQAWLRGQYAAAIDSARKALRVRPGMTNAYQIIAVCSCALHDADSAAKAIERLDDRNRQFVKSACQKNGISF